MLELCYYEHTAHVQARVLGVLGSSIEKTPGCRISAVGCTIYRVRVYSQED